MDIQREGRQVAMAFVNVDDIVLVRELTGSGVNLLSFAGRSLVGTAVLGAGMATRAAVFGAQVATKSALAVATVAKGRIPGGALAEQWAYDLDQTVGRGGEVASYVAAQGVEIAKADGRPPTEPIFGEAWLGKRLKPGATPTTVLVESALDLTRLAAVPLTFGTARLTSALATPMGQQVTRSFWDALFSLVDSFGPRSSRERASSADRSERRAVRLAVALAPLTVFAGDMVELAEGLSRASAGEAARLRAILTKILARLDASSAAAYTPVRLLAALDDTHESEAARVAAIGRAMVEDGAALSRLAVTYATQVGTLVTNSMQSAVSGALDVDAIEAWVRADDASRSADVPSARAAKCPASVAQLESVVADFSGADAAAGRRGFFLPSTIELARDTIFTYSTRALGRERALARMERLFGADARARLEDDCSLRAEILDAKADRDRRLAALVSQVQQEGSERLRVARDRAAERLASLAANSADRMLERLVPQRLAERVAILQRFVGLADTANALDPDPSAETSRQQVVAEFTAWMAVPAPGAGVQIA
jgi:hypothetical protein